jgi:hypothetical protein
LVARVEDFAASVASPGPAMLNSQTIENHMMAERLRADIAQVERANQVIAARFKTYALAPVEEQLAIKLAFIENRTRLGELCQELLRLLCSDKLRRWR